MILVFVIGLHTVIWKDPLLGLLSFYTSLSMSVCEQRPPLFT